MARSAFYSRSIADLPLEGGVLRAIPGAPGAKKGDTRQAVE